MQLVLALLRVAAASAASMLAPVLVPGASSLPGAGRPSTSFAAEPCAPHLSVTVFILTLSKQLGPRAGEGSQNSPKAGSRSLRQALRVKATWLDYDSWQQLRRHNTAS